MGRMNNIIHRRRAARNAVKDARHAPEAAVIPEVEEEAPKKPRWSRRRRKNN